MDSVSVDIDRESGVSIALQISNQILKMILDGTLKLGQRLPPERDLAEQLGVSRGTIKRAYTRLDESNAISIRQGSGSYVVQNSLVLEKNQKKEASLVVSETFAKLRDMGLSNKEILSLVNLRYLSDSGGEQVGKINIMVVSNNHEILSELEQQLSYLTDTSPYFFTLTFLTLDMVENNPDPVQLLLSYDLIIATMIDYDEVLEIAPMLNGRIIKATISPRTRTLVQLSHFPTSSKFNVIYRTAVFRDIILQSLYSLEFAAENIYTYKGAEYLPEHHKANGVNGIINFNDSPVFSDSRFEDANSEFLAGGGQIIRFEYQIERKSLVHIEDQIQKIVEQREAEK